ATKFLVRYEGEPYVAGVAIEITERMLALEEVGRVARELFRHERLRAIGEMTSGIAHDFNNMLSAMNLRLQVLRGENDREQLSDHVEAMSRLINDLSSRVHDLQDFVRQRRQVKLEDVDLSFVIRDAIELIRHEVEQRSALDGFPVRIVNEIGKLPPVHASPRELRHLFMNLILNARDAMAAGGGIFIRGSVDRGHVMVSIEDEGSGISSDVLAKIFAPFFTTKGARGSGLGLSMAKDVMNSIGGGIRAANRESGGAIFTLSFPLANCDLSGASG
ncbi:MAG TPA: ATP-binding protein, partial [Candidatus Binataceae bacterium]